MANPALPTLLGGALAASALLLATAWYLGDPGPSAGPAEAASLDPDDFPGRFTEDANAPRQNPLQAVERSTFLTEQDGKQTALTWDVLTPRTDFVSDVEAPRARVELGPGRLLVLEAAEGTVEHPGNDFQRGSFRGGTVVTFHRLASPAAPESDANAVLRLALAGPTSFDRELGRLSTAGPVRVSGPRVDLAGTGLELDFSRAEEEVKKLVLDETEFLRLRREEAGGAAAGVPPTPTPTPDPESAARSAETGGATDAATPTPRPEATPATVYRVEASGGVTIDADSGTRLTGRTLLVFFAAGEGLGGGDAEATPPPGPADRGAQAAGTPAIRGGDPAPPPAPAEAGASLFQPGPGTVELAWTGPLRLRPAAPGEGPEAVRSAAFTGAHLQLGGTAEAPATAASGAARIAAASLAYTTADGRLDATGVGGAPVRAEDPGAGTLTAQRIEATPGAGVARAAGPGVLTARDPDAADAGDALRVAFQAGMDLAFDPAEGEREALAIRSAVFTGRVGVDAAAPGGASGGDGFSGGGPLRLDASRVTLGFGAAPGGGQPAPKSLLADGGVVATRRPAGAKPDAEPLWTLRSEDLRVALSPSPTDPQRPEIAGLEASGGVTVETLDAGGLGEAAPETADAAAEPLYLAADRLTASPRLDRVELNGTDGLPATAARGGFRLSGGTIIAGLAGERLEVRGPGELRSLPAGPGPGDGPGAGSDETRLTWTTGLAYDGATGEAEAQGETLTTSQSATERRRIEAGGVFVTFETAHAGAEPDAGGPAPGGFASLRTLRASAPVGGNRPVVVVVETLGPGGATASTLRAEGPRLDLDVLPAEEGGRQLLTMPGPGKLILVDERPGGDATPAGDAAPAVRLAGRGATFFRWATALRLDGRSRDAELTGDVFMNHDPRDGRPRVKLYGDRLLATFAGEGEPAGGATAPAAGADLRQVRIDGSVVVEQDERVITADHLLYRTGEDEVQLWSDADRGMAITADNRTLPARSATWNLMTDRVDVRGVGGTTGPLR
ncbi:hypothetical protein [Phycisphaera mikurensis]|uniref:Uncharacterized protein n=1 Tax=Phycisphaera mikurensis (strain NBRC 102666 / KCTC 22515 / FYK2301M01) TaxID=1142394 RepID=I0IBT1_PHYMF|nr:hypothetical protein [Phycisphaera mikurensis]MBB6442052.1 hypothetical protein [Phycisphaera mikurensis]BAM02719.1 hypothetical protein PSMK_05600 [Phycisphaera mikurensis NBRC 102666]